MTQSYVTQCPHCRTSFRVNQTQLAAAHGVVRCGACLHVFNAAQQLRESGMLPATPVPQVMASRPIPAVEQPAATLRPPAAPAPSQTVSKPKLADDTLWIHDDLDLDGLDLDEELAKLEAQEQAFSRQFLAAEAAPKPAEHFLRAGELEQPAEIDESWTQALLNDSPSVPASPAPAPQPPASQARSAIQPAATVEHTETRGMAIEQEDLPSSPPVEEIELSDRRSAFTPTPLSFSALDTQPDQDEAEPDISERPAARARRNEPAVHDESLFDLDDEPLQLDWQPQQRKPWGRWLGWGLLNLLAASALGGQYLSYNFDELARQDQYRPWFEQMCPLIECTLPSKVDVSQVKSSNLVVRSHPQFAGALVVDAILYNRAPFTQPFPLLEMRFADINGQLLASRRFKPSEYLAGELAGQAQMPPQTPIHISMDILDPGAQAVNYSIHFHSPE